MTLKGISLAVLSTAFALATAPVPVLPAAAADSNGKDCGWYNENGKVVFKGTCPHDSSEGTTGEPQPTNPCPVMLFPGGRVMVSYRIVVTGC